MANKIVKIDPDFRAGAGVCTLISYTRLEDVLREAGELRPKHRVTGYHMDDFGINFYITQKDKADE